VTNSMVCLYSNCRLSSARLHSFEMSPRRWSTWLQKHSKSNGV